jgi:excisionase family DNA binding protein
VTAAMEAFLADFASQVAAEVAARLPAPDRLLTSEQAADRLGVTDRTVGNLMRRGELTFVKVGASTRIEESEIARYVASRRVAR